jgi:FkbM family methyltransferase
MNLTSVIKAAAKTIPFGEKAIEFVSERKYHRIASKTGSFSQHGEDLFIRDYFAGKKELGNYIDVGAGHPFIINNTYLLYTLGWRGITVEPIPRLFEKHRRYRAEDIQLQCGVADSNSVLPFFEMVPHVLSTCDTEEADRLIGSKMAVLLRKRWICVVTLAEICNKYLPSRQLDLLSIDTEGLELQVLQGLDWNAIQPQLVVCEFSTPTHASEGLTEFLINKGYRQLKVLGCNSIWGKS